LQSSIHQNAAWQILIQRSAGMGGERRALDAVAADLIVLLTIDRAAVLYAHTLSVVDLRGAADQRDRGQCAGDPMVDLQQTVARSLGFLTRRLAAFGCPSCRAIAGPTSAYSPAFVKSLTIRIVFRETGL
jgi:hypothetical protein